MNQADLRESLFGTAELIAELEARGVVPSVCDDGAISPTKVVEHRQRSSGLASSSFWPPVILSGIEALRFEAESFGDGHVSATVARYIESADLRAEGLTLDEIGRRAGISREAARQVLERLVSMTLHPCLLGASVKYWEGLRSQVEAQRLADERAALGVGEAVVLLKYGATHPAWEALHASRPEIWSAVRAEIAETVEPFQPGRGAGRHVLDVPGLTPYLGLLVRHGLLYEAQIRALPPSHPAARAVEGLRDAAVAVDTGEFSEAADIQGDHVSTLGLSVRANNVLKREGIETVGQLVRRSADELMCMRSAGSTTVNEISERLRHLGLTLRGNLEPF